METKIIYLLPFTLTPHILPEDDHPPLYAFPWDLVHFVKVHAVINA
jgi:hypothetical protein